MPGGLQEAQHLGARRGRQMDLPGWRSRPRDARRGDHSSRRELRRFSGWHRAVEGASARLPKGRHRPGAPIGLPAFERRPMTCLAKVPCTIVTGFLGAGKTTLVRHVRENANGRLLAVIVNEFGDVGIDGEILKGCGIETCPEEAIVELSNGCLCCTVADEFVPALSGLLERARPPDHILIETSGLALPKPLVQ